MTDILLEGLKVVFAGIVFGVVAGFSQTIGQYFAHRFGLKHLKDFDKYNRRWDE